ncbi:MAG: GNAT family N-acetyltransferase [Candidatus Freyarchaeota archaeon]
MVTLKPSRISGAYELPLDSSYELRNYQPGDEYQIVELFNAAFGKNRVFVPRVVKYWVWRYPERPEFDPKGIFLLERDGRIVSSIIESIRKVRLGGRVLRFGIIDDVSTLPELWGQGLASRLLEEAIGYAEQKNLDGLALFADPEGHAHILYQRYGFIDAKRYLIYVGFLGQEDTASQKRSDTVMNGVFERLTHENLESYYEKFNAAHERLEWFYPMSLDELRWKLLDSSKVLPSETWIEIKNGKIAGGGTLSVRKMIAFDTEIDFAVLENVFTHERNDTETARKIVHKLLDEGAGKNCNNAMCMISSGCPLRQKTLESAGFQKINESVQMIKPLSDFDPAESARLCWYAPYEHMIG